MAADAPWWAPPVLAIQFLTRLPIPGTAYLDAVQARDGLAKAVGWFPLVGTLVGVITASIVYMADLAWPRAVAVLIALAIEARLTGAFHEDAVADFCDAFGGGQDAEAVRRIMKDSRIGSYGALGLFLAVALRAVLIGVLPPSLLVSATIASATFGRLLAVAVMTVVSPAPAGTGLARDVASGIDGRHMLFAVLTAIPGLALFAWTAPFALAATLAASGLFLWWFARLLRRRIGGSTGDCLGFSAYAGQIGLLLAATATL